MCTYVVQISIYNVFTYIAYGGVNHVHVHVWFNDDSLPIYMYSVLWGNFLSLLPQATSHPIPTIHTMNFLSMYGYVNVFVLAR